MHRLSLKRFLLSIALRLRSLGIDLKKIAALRYLPLYWRQRADFKKLGGVPFRNDIVLVDYTESAGVCRGHYFHQDLLVASFINESAPHRHIDIGSRIDGFVAHVASFRKIEVWDIRNLPYCGHPNIVSRQVDLMRPGENDEGVTDSLSCLHAIEHFGLGRYGDTVDPDGHIKGFNNLLKLLKKDGTLYISFPIGTKTEVHFNAQRVFHPLEIFSWPRKKSCLQLKRFDFVDDLGNLHKNINPTGEALACNYGCGIYTLLKRE